MKLLRFIITLMNMVPMLNARIFITNKHDSNARLAALRQSTGNNQTWRTRVECSDLHHQRTRFFFFLLSTKSDIAYWCTSESGSGACTNLIRARCVAIYDYKVMLVDSS